MTTTRPVQSASEHPPAGAHRAEDELPPDAEFLFAPGALHAAIADRGDDPVDVVARAVAPVVAALLIAAGYVPSRRQRLRDRWPPLPWAVPWIAVGLLVVLAAGLLLWQVTR